MRKDPRKQNHQRHRGYCARGGFVGHTIWSRTVGPVPDTAGAQCRPHTQLPAHMPAAATHDTECVRVARGRIAATPCAQLRTPAMDASPRRLRHLPLVSTGMQLLALPVRYLVLVPLSSTLVLAVSESTIHQGGLLGPGCKEQGQWCLAS